MTPDDVRAAAEQLVDVHERFAPLLGVEEFLEDCKSYLGMTQYQTRSWVRWHHHMTLVGLAHLFVTLVQRRLQKKRRS
jgi:SRSO17 transposase